MVLEEFAGSKKKRPKSYSMDDYLIERIATLSETGKFGSQSNIVSTAVAEFLAKNETTILEQQERQINAHIAAYLQSPEGEELIRSILRKSLAASEEKSAATPVIVKEQ